MTQTPPAQPPVFDLVPKRAIGVSFRQSWARRVRSGFMARYFSGAAILDIGYRGGDPTAVPITEAAIGVELDYPGYDGVTLPFDEESQDTVLAAHVLEHIPDYPPVLRDWHRVLKIGGHMVIMVPHRDLYERQADLPSRWNGDHKRLYTPASLMREIETSLPVNGYRLRHLVDNDHGFDYARGPALPPTGCYEIELVIEKIRPPAYTDRLRHSPPAQAALDQFDRTICEAVRANLAQPGEGVRLLSALTPALGYFPPWFRLRTYFPGEDEGALRRATRPLLGLVRFDEALYLGQYVDLLRAKQLGKMPDARAHWMGSGYFEGRVSATFEPFPAPAKA